MTRRIDPNERVNEERTDPTFEPVVDYSSSSSSDSDSEDSNSDYESASSPAASSSSTGSASASPTGPRQRKSYTVRRKIKVVEHYASLKPSEVEIKTGICFISNSVGKVSFISPTFFISYLNSFFFYFSLE